MSVKGLYLILTAAALLSAALLVWQRQEQLRFCREQEEIRVRQTEALRVAEVRRAAEQEHRRRRAELAVAVGGEYWKIARAEGRILDQGQATLRRAKDALAASGYETAVALARQSIAEFKAARKGTAWYRVQRGDTLWKIARMPRFYGRGSLWTKIWRANEKKIPDFDVIHPSRVLVIPSLDDDKKRKTINP